MGNLEIKKLLLEILKSTSKIVDEEGINLSTISLSYLKIINNNAEQINKIINEQHK